jgi:hypothetical protein
MINRDSLIFSMIVFLSVTLGCWAYYFFGGSINPEIECKHQYIVYKCDPVTMERRVGAKVRLNYRPYCVDCGIEIEFIEPNYINWGQYNFRNVENVAYALCGRKSIDVNEPFFLTCPVCEDAKCVNKEYDSGKYACVIYGFGIKGHDLCCGLCKKLFSDDWVLIGTKIDAD